ncbi:MAG: hypothetical protein EBS68_10115 [Rhodobacteraceae bacterium]|nr:hypothetical protein [Paracoccaceae bacterium]
MLDLSEKSPCAGMLPATAGAMRLEEVNPGPIWALAPNGDPGATDALARLSTLDLQTMPEGATARSHIGHMMGHITRLGAEDWRLMVFRSMASTLVREVKEAMHHVHARHG